MSTGASRGAGIDRRTFVIGASTTAAGVFAGVGVESASADGGTVLLPAELAEHVSAGVIDVVPFDTDVRVRVHVLPGARIVRHGQEAQLTDFAAGEGLAVEAVLPAARADAERFAARQTIQTSGIVSCVHGSERPA